MTSRLRNQSPLRSSTKRRRASRLRNRRTRPPARSGPSSIPASLRSTRRSVPRPSSVITPASPLPSAALSRPSRSSPGPSPRPALHCSPLSAMPGYRLEVSVDESRLPGVRVGQPVDGHTGYGRPPFDGARLRDRARGRFRLADLHGQDRPPGDAQYPLGSLRPRGVSARLSQCPDRPRGRAHRARPAPADLRGRRRPGAARA